MGLNFAFRFALAMNSSCSAFPPQANWRWPASVAGYQPKGNVNGLTKAPVATEGPEGSVRLAPIHAPCWTAKHAHCGTWNGPKLGEYQAENVGLRALSPSKTHDRIPRNDDQIMEFVNAA